MTSGEWPVKQKKPTQRRKGREDSRRRARLLEVAKSCRGPRAAAELMADRVLFLAHVMTYGEIEDLVVAKKYFTESNFRSVLDQPPAHVFDPWSWNYWNVKFGRFPAPSMSDAWFGFKRVRDSVSWDVYRPPPPEPA